MGRKRLRLSKASGKRAAIYLRKSHTSNKLQAESIDSQRKVIVEYAARHGYEIVAEFVDSGITGVDSASDRPEFQRVIAAAERGEFDYLIAWDQSRLTRSDSMQTAAELMPLRRAGVRLALTDKPEPIDWESFAGQLTMAIESESNNSYVKKLARGSVRRAVQLAKEGRWVAGKPPLGYRLDGEHRLILGPRAEVAAVRWAYRAYAGGESYRGVIAGLKTRGFSMVVSGVKNLLQNPLYVGDFHWGRNTQAKFYSYRGGDITGDFDTGANDDVVVVPDNHPPIIKRADWQHVQTLFDGRRRQGNPKRNGGGFIFTGLLRCADCGHRMVGHTANAKKLFYRCGGSQIKGTAFCHPHHVGQDELLSLVLKTLRARYTDPAIIKRLKAAVRDELKQTKKTVDAAGLRRQLSGQQGKLKKAQRRLVEVDHDLLGDVQEQIRDIKATIESIEIQLQMVSTDLGEAYASIDERADAAMAVFSRLESARSNPTALRAYLGEVIDRIVIAVDREKVNQRYRYNFVGGEIILKQDAELFTSPWRRAAQNTHRIHAAED